jgi:hypothetical protein
MRLVDLEELEENYFEQLEESCKCDHLEEGCTCLTFDEWLQELEASYWEGYEEETA